VPFYPFLGFCGVSVIPFSPARFPFFTRHLSFFHPDLSFFHPAPFRLSRLAGGKRAKPRLLPAGKRF